ncbi:MAG: uncharacterized protein QOJ56_1003 [Mycobacterium sp.]|jgi:hypothetical protein|nr:uncharacterized protein [Mycobacterium sp.]MDT7719639.1 uncharacterized protein [Mycobacterium sp.]
MATAEVVQLFLERLGKGDVDGITKLFADDIDWWAPGTVLPWAGRRSHSSDVPEFFRVLECACVPAETPGRRGEDPRRRRGCRRLRHSDELTPTMKLKRRSIEQKYAAQIDALYTTKENR